MPTITPLQLISLALKDAGILGVGQTAAAEDTNDAFVTLNMMLSQWNHDRWLIYRLIDVSCPSTGAASYTVGIGEDFDTPRPDRIEFSFVRQYPANEQPVDQTIRVLNAREDFNRITVKLTTGPARYVFYDSAYPIGSAFFWPLSQATIYTHFITVKEQLTEFADLVTPIALPAEYLPALRYGLGMALRPLYQLAPDQQLANLAQKALGVIRGANAQIPRLVMPSAVMGNGARYDIWSDQVR